MLKKAVTIFAVTFITLGLLGFVPALTPLGASGMPLLLGIFMIDTTHNVVHIASGVVALAAAVSNKYARLYLQIFGIIYGLITLLGFFGSPVLGFLHVNIADNFLHLAISGSALALGFGKFGVKN